MTDTALDDLDTRVRLLEDESAIQRLVMTYGPAGQPLPELFTTEAS